MQRRTVRRDQSGYRAKALAPAATEFGILRVHSGHQAGDLWQRGRRGQQTDSDQQEEVLVDIVGGGAASPRASGPSASPLPEGPGSPLTPRLPARRLRG